MFAVSMLMVMLAVPIFPVIHALVHQIFRHRMRADPEPQMEQHGEHGNPSDAARHKTSQKPTGKSYHANHAGIAGIGQAENLPRKRCKCKWIAKSRYMGDCEG